ncbi:hypothetical protein LTR17_027905 [Elasticomyces elasticus]|nr:hypothetical protein LTR17_027905 [Elasticomyces elasticus]
MKLRGLRDQLQQALDLSLGEMEAFEPLAKLPHARPWPVHHQRLFQEALHAYEEKWDDNTDFDKYPLCVQRAAREWSTKSCRPVEMDPAFHKRTNDANAFRVATDDVPTYT